MTTANDRSNSSTARLTSATQAAFPWQGAFCRAQIFHDVVDQLKHVVGRRVGGASYVIRQAGERAGLGRVWPHMLRHSAGYALSNKGHDFRLLQDFMGHRDPRHTSRYTRTASRRFEGLWK